MKYYPLVALLFLSSISFAANLQVHYKFSNGDADKIRDAILLLNPKPDNYQGTNDQWVASVLAKEGLQKCADDYVTTYLNINSQNIIKVLQDEIKKTKYKSNPSED